MKNKNTGLTDEELKAECIYQSQNVGSSDTSSDEITKDREDALNMYFGRPDGYEREGGSTIQSMDVSDMVNSMLSQSMSVFNSADLVQFEATSEEDEGQAATESSWVNRIVNDKNNGYTLWQTLLKDCMLSKNSTAKVYVDVKIDTEKERYKGLSEEEMYSVMQPTKANQEIDFTRFDKKKGDINLKRITTTRKLMVSAVAPENFGVTYAHNSPYLDECDYCFERGYQTRSELVSEGYDKDAVYELPHIVTDTNTESLDRDQTRNQNNIDNRNASMQLLEIYTHIIRCDRDGDGISQLLQVKTVGNNLLYKKGKADIKEVECVPYANGIIILMGHRYHGLSIHDLIKNIQHMKTHFLRQWADNAMANNHSKTDVIEDQVNMDDFLSGRVAPVRRVESLDSARDVPVNDIGPSCLLMLDYQDKLRTERAGSSLDLQAQNMKMPSNVGDQGVQTIIDTLEQVQALMIRNFCQTQVKSVYKLVHKFMRMEMPENMTAKIGSKWSRTNPKQWTERDDITITVPPTSSEKLVQSIALSKAILMASQEMQQGKAGITTDEGSIYQMKVDYMRLSGIDNPEKYLVNPDSPEAQQAAQQAQQMQAQEAQRQEQKQDAMFMAQLEIQQTANANAQAEIMRNYEADKEELAQKWDASNKDIEFKYSGLEKEYAELKQKYDEMYLKAEVEEAKIVGSATTAIEVESLKQIPKYEEPEEEEETEND